MTMAPFLICTLHFAPQQERQRLAARQSADRERFGQWVANEVTQMATCVPDHLVLGTSDSVLQSVANINIKYVLTESVPCP